MRAPLTVLVAVVLGVLLADPVFAAAPSGGWYGSIHTDTTFDRTQYGFPPFGDNKLVQHDDTTTLFRGDLDQIIYGSFTSRETNEFPHLCGFTGIVSDDLQTVVGRSEEKTPETPAAIVAVGAALQPGVAGTYRLRQGYVHDTFDEYLVDFSNCATHEHNSTGTGAIGLDIIDTDDSGDSVNSLSAPADWTHLQGTKTISTRFEWSGGITLRRTVWTWDLTYSAVAAADFTAHWNGPTGNSTTIGNSVTFQALVPSGATVSWTFGDGTTGTGQTITHVYATPGERIVTMTATDHGLVASNVHTVTANPIRSYAPLVHMHPLEIYWPGDAMTYIANSRLLYVPQDSLLDICGADTLARGSLVPGNPHLLIDPNRLGERSTVPYGHPITATTCTGAGTLLANGDPASVAKSKSRFDGGFGFVLDLEGNSGIHNPSPQVYARRRGILPPANAAGAPVYAEWREDTASGNPYVIYWFFYPYNGWLSPHENIAEVHEGDWEHIVVRLNPFSVATDVAYYQHYCSAEVHPRGEFFPTVGGEKHFPAWSALGGHATYPVNVGEVGGLGSCGNGSGRGDQTGDGLVWNTSLNIALAMPQPWYGFGGAWGDLGKANGPAVCLPDPIPTCNYGPPGPGTIHSSEEDRGEGPNDGAAIPIGWG